jgi:hypothetical protein
VRHHVEVFDGFDAVVVPSGSCVGSVRHQHAMVARRFGDAPLAARAETVAAHTYELSEFLVDVLGVVEVGAYFCGPGTSRRAGDSPPSGWRCGTLGRVMSSPRRFRAATRAARLARPLWRRKGRITTLPGSRWTTVRGAPLPPPQTFHEWWRGRYHREGGDPRSDPRCAGPIPSKRRRTARLSAFGRARRRVG